VHIGGSHIQADIWSGRTRERLQTFVGGCKADRGFVFPYKAARTNTPWNYKVKSTGSWKSCRNVQRSKTCDLGLGGISVTTHDSLSSIVIIPRKKFGSLTYPSYSFNSVKVFHRMDSTSFQVVVADTLLEYATRRDSVAGYTEFTFNKHVDTLHIRIIQTDTIQESFQLFGMLMENEDPGMTYHSIGVNGASVPSYLKCQRFVQELAEIRPELVILSVGINDEHGSDFRASEYQMNYDTLVSMIREA